MKMAKDDLRSLKGVGPSVEDKLNNLDIFKQTDLLSIFLHVTKTEPP